MSQELIAIPELLPPMALPELIQPATTATRAALAGMALLAVAGIWRVAAPAVMLISEPNPVTAASVVAAAPSAQAQAIMPQAGVQASAGQPAALSLPTDGDRPGAATAVGIGQ